MFRTIVVGCDESINALRAIELAEQLRDPEDGRLILTCVFPFYRGFAAPVGEDSKAGELREEARGVVERVSGHVSADVPFEVKAVSAPSAGAGLNDLAEELDADLIVLGPTHRNELGRLAGRSTVQRMLEGAPCAVAVAAPDQRDRFDGDARIFVAYDASPEAMHARDTAFRIASAKHAAVRLCAAIEPTNYATGYVGSIPDVGIDDDRERAVNESLVEAAEAAPDDIDVDGAIGWGAPASALLKMAGDDASLVVAGSRGYGTLHRLLAGATSGALLTNGRVPVLVTPRGTEARDDSDAVTETSV